MPRIIMILWEHMVFKPYSFIFIWPVLPPPLIPIIIYFLYFLCFFKKYNFLLKNKYIYHFNCCLLQVAQYIGLKEGSVESHEPPWITLDGVLPKLWVIDAQRIFLLILMIIISPYGR